MRRSILTLLLCVVFSPTVVLADVGLPMLVIAWPIFWCAFIPIVFIEFWIVKKKLLGIATKRLLGTVFLSNFLSTLIGIPIVWICMVTLEFLTGNTGNYPSLTRFWRLFFGVTLQSAWIIPYEQECYWMIPTAFIVLLVPFFIVSYWIEEWVTFELLINELLSNGKTPSSADISQAVWKSNIYSYAFLLALSLLFLSYKIAIEISQ